MDRAIDLIADGATHSVLVTTHSVLVIDDEGHLAGYVTDADLPAYLG